MSEVEESELRKGQRSVVIVRFVCAVLVFVALSAAIILARSWVDPGTLPYEVLTALAVGLTVGGTSALVAEYFLRNSFVRYLRSTVDELRNGERSRLRGMEVWTSTSKHDEEIELAIRTDPKFTALLNTGENFVENYRGQILDRFKSTKPNGKLRIVLVDPASDFARVLEGKERRSAGQLRGVLSQTLEKLAELGATDENCSVVLHRLVGTMAAYLGSTKVYAADYMLSATRLNGNAHFYTLPRLAFSATRSKKSPFQLFSDDLETMISAPEYVAAGLVNDLTFNQAVDYARNLEVRTIGPVAATTGSGETLVNLTPHPLQIMSSASAVPSTVIPPAGALARVDFEPSNSGNDHVLHEGVRIPVRSGSFASVEGLPARVAGRRYIVSTVVALASGRSDLLFPQGHQRDVNGNVIGNSEFGRLDSIILTDPAPPAPEARLFDQEQAAE